MNVIVNNFFKEPNDIRKNISKCFADMAKQRILDRGRGRVVSYNKVMPSRGSAESFEKRGDEV